MKLLFKKSDISPKDIIFVDYYFSAVSTVDSGGYYEIVLSSCDIPEKTRLDRYVKEDADSPTVKTSFLVPSTAVDECMSIITREKLSSWNDMENVVSIDGAKIVCKFWDGEKQVRVSNDSMPENGEAIMGSIRKAMEKYINDERRISNA